MPKKGKGDSVTEVIATVLASKQHPEQSYKTCLGILGLSKTYGEFRLNKACERALFYENCTYKVIKNILINNMDQVRKEDELNSSLPEHENIRGNKYYIEELQ